MIKILASAYDINPYKGSESGTGWNFVVQLSRFNKVVAVTRKNNRSEIERYIIENSINVDNIEFSYYDLPYLLRFWKRGSRGSFLYYNLWQMFLPLFILRNKLTFDATQHINFHADHVPSFLWVFNKPFFWGPINHNEPIPKEFLRSKKEFLKDRGRFLIKWLRWNFDPFLLLCRKKARVVIGSSESVMNRLRIDPEKFRKVSTVSARPSNVISVETPNKFTVVSVGRQVPIKSFDLSIRAFDHFYSLLNYEQRNNVQLLLIGDGPLYHSLLALSETLESRDAIQFIKWVEQKELDSLYSTSSLILIPSHEGAGAVVAEGLSFGLPVVCFDNNGAGEIIDDTCGCIVPYGTYKGSYGKMGDELYTLFSDRNYLNKLRNGAIRYFDENLSWDCKGDQISNIYKEFLD